MLPRFQIVVLIIVLAPMGALSAAEWPDFRGPNANGIANVSGTPAEWSESGNVAWKTAVPGKGWSTPVVADGRIWMTTAIEEIPTDEERIAILTKLEKEPKKFKQLHVAKSITLALVVVDYASGELLHTQNLIKLDTPDAIHNLNSYASPTPIIDGSQIYCHFGTYGTICIERESLREIWRRELTVAHSVGPGSSPFIHQNRLVLICDGTENQYVTALDKSTGETLWKTDRPAMDAASGEQKKAYCTPIAVKDSSGRDQLICMGSQWLVSYSPESGEEIWRVRHGKGFSVVPRPVHGDGVVYISTGFGKPELWAVRVDGEGDVTESHVQWVEIKGIPAKPSPLLLDGRVYVVSDDGIATCFAAEDGATIWKKRIGGKYSSSPLFADGKIYIGSHEGKVTVIRPGDSYDAVAENQLDGQIMASPVAIDKSLLIRTDKAIYRIGA